MKLFFKFTTVCLFFVGAYSVADTQYDLGADGYFFLYSPFDFQSPNQASSSLWVDGKVEFDQVFSLKMQVANEFRDSSPTNTSDGFKMNAREAVARFQKGGFDWSLGKQIVPWGNSDAYHPTDFLGGKDLSFFSSDEELKREGSWSSVASWIPNQGDSPLSVTLVVTPYFQETTLLIPSSVVPQGVTVSDLERPDVNLRNVEEAIKLTYYGDGWDGTLVGFRGFHHTPAYRLVSISSSSLVTVAPAFHRVYAIGGYGSYAMSSWIFRGETSFRSTDFGNGTRELIPPSYLDSVIGVERPLGDYFRFHFQGIWKHHVGYTTPGAVTGSSAAEQAALQQLDLSNALLLGFQNQDLWSTTLRITYSSENQEWQAQTFFFINWTGGDYLVKPQITYQPWDNLKWTLGMDYFGGDSSRPLGSLHDFSSFFLETKAYF